MIRVDTKVDGIQNSIANLGAGLSAHLVEDAANYRDLIAKVAAAHRRIDWMLVTVVLASIFLGITIWFKR